MSQVITTTLTSGQVFSMPYSISFGNIITTGLAIMLIGLLAVDLCLTMRRDA